MAKKILVVDDEEGIRETLSLVLEDEGYETVTASSGSEALANLSTDSFDVVITDLRMPAPDGMEILKTFLYEAFMDLTMSWQEKQELHKTIPTGGLLDILRY